MKFARVIIQSILNRLGIALYRYPMWLDPNPWRAKMLRSLNISVVIDAGANIGQYVEILRNGSYHGKIISFEPVDFLYNELLRKSAKDPDWRCEKIALGDVDQISEIKVAGTMSSFFSRAETASKASEFSTSESQQVQVKPLDSLRGNLYSSKDRVWLKMDVQGYELTLLRGAKQALTDIVGIETEMSLWPTYSGQPTYTEIIAHLTGTGFDLWSLSPGQRDETSGRLIEMDGIFVKRGYLLQSGS